MRNIYVKDNIINTPEEKVVNILKVIDVDFKVMYSFSVFTTSEGDRKHSIKLSFYNKEKKDKTADHPLRQWMLIIFNIYLTNKENNRLRAKARGIRIANPNDTVNIDKGKLYHNDSS